jgi:arylsulfatase A-like enzyme
MALRGAAVRQGDWKLLMPSSLPPALYDLSTDVGEQRDLSAEHPDVAARLRAALNTWEVELERNPLFVSVPYWAGYNRRLYHKTFTRVQPAPDDDRDHWSFRD